LLHLEHLSAALNKQNLYRYDRNLLPPRQERDAFRGDFLFIDDLIELIEFPLSFHAIAMSPNGFNEMHAPIADR